MQYYINDSGAGLLVLLGLAIAIPGVFLFLCRNGLAKERQLNIELLECLDCKDGVLEEFKRIRHEYNNMLQTVTCFIEEEDLEGLKEYQDRLMEKTHLLNSNNLAQMAKIKDKNILKIVYKLYMTAKETGIAFNITIFNDIMDISPHKTEINNILKGCLNLAYDSAAKGEGDIHLKISSDDKGLRFCLEGSISGTSENLSLRPARAGRSTKYGSDIFFNTFHKNGHLIQEILIPLNQ